MSNDAQLHYPYDQVLPTTGELFMLRPGLAWLRMPLPFALDHINLWLLQDGDEWCAVDCGIDSPATRAAWQQIFTGNGEQRRLSQVISTHCHPDHVGLAHWLCEQFGVRLRMSLGEYASARLMSAGLPGTDHQSAIAHFQRHGIDEVQLAMMQARQNHYPSLVPTMPANYARLQDGDEIRVGEYCWRVITGFGHAPEHVSLYCEALQILISGDMVLPRISTNVSVFALEPEANPLQLYLDSLSKFQDLPARTLVLPSHGKPFIGLHTRITQLRQHHDLRLQEVRQACVTEQSAAQIVPIMFQRQLDAHQLNFALGEALAHLNKLWYDNILVRKCGTDLIIRFEMQVEVQ